MQSFESPFDAAPSAAGKQDGARWCGAPGASVRAGALTHKGGGSRGLPLAVGGGGCRFKCELARLEAGRSPGTAAVSRRHHLVAGVEVEHDEERSWRSARPLRENGPVRILELPAALPWR
jgi:hypothetical protein